MTGTFCSPMFGGSVQKIVAKPTAPATPAVMKIHDGLWAGLMRTLAGGVLAFAVGWLSGLKHASHIKIGWRVTLATAIGFSMGFVGAFYSDMLLEVILYEAGV